MNPNRSSRSASRPVSANEAAAQQLSPQHAQQQQGIQYSQQHSTFSAEPQAHFQVNRNSVPAWQRSIVSTPAPVNYQQQQQHSYSGNHQLASYQQSQIGQQYQGQAQSFAPAPIQSQRASQPQYSIHNQVLDAHGEQSLVTTSGQQQFGNPNIQHGNSQSYAYLQPRPASDSAGRPFVDADVVQWLSSKGIPCRLIPDQTGKLLIFIDNHPEAAQRGIFGVCPPGKNFCLVSDPNSGQAIIFRVNGTQMPGNTGERNLNMAAQQSFMAQNDATMSTTNSLMSTNTSQISDDLSSQGLDVIDNDEVQEGKTSRGRGRGSRASTRARNRGRGRGKKGRPRLSHIPYPQPATQNDTQNLDTAWQQSDPATTLNPFQSTVSQDYPFAQTSQQGLSIDNRAITPLATTSNALVHTPFGGSAINDVNPAGGSTVPETSQINQAGDPHAAQPTNQQIPGYIGLNNVYQGQVPPLVPVNLPGLRLGNDFGHRFDGTDSMLPLWWYGVRIQIKIPERQLPVEFDTGHRFDLPLSAHKFLDLNVEEVFWRHYQGRFQVQLAASGQHMVVPHTHQTEWLDVFRGWEQRSFGGLVVTGWVCAFEEHPDYVAALVEAELAYFDNFNTEPWFGPDEPGYQPQQQEGQEGQGGQELEGLEHNGNVDDGNADGGYANDDEEDDEDDSENGDQEGDEDVVQKSK